MQVKAKDRWQSAKFLIPNGTVVTITASGRWLTHGKNWNGPEGFTSLGHSGYYGHGLHEGSLIAKIERGPRVVITEIGVSGQISADFDGELFLSANDEEPHSVHSGFNDNEGYVTAVIQVPDYVPEI